MSEKNERREFKLPTSGKTASVIVQGKGKHLRQAARIAGPQANQFDAMAAMAAVKCLIEGEPFTTEDLDELDEDDVNALLSEASGVAERQRQEEAKKKAKDAASGKAPPGEDLPSPDSSSPNGT